MAHHHQLTAHSQLTTLSPGQIHYIQLPTSILPTAAIYQDNRSYHHNQHTFLRATHGIAHVGESCLICLQPLPPRVNHGGKRPVEVLEKAYQLLHISIEENDHEWNYVQSGKNVFCVACTDLLQGLFALQEQMEAIQKRLDEGLNNIRQTMQATNDRVPANDLRTINFRSKALRNGSLNSSTTSCHNDSTTNVQESFTKASVIGIPDLACLLNTPLTNAIAQNDTSMSMGHQEYINGTSTSMSLVPTPSTQYPPILSQAIFNTVSDCPGNTLSNPGQADMNTINSLEQGYNYFDNGNDFYSNSGIDSERDEDYNDNDETEESEGNTENFVETSMKQTSVMDNCGAPETKRYTSVKRQCNEYFAPVQTDDQGRMLFEGIVINHCESGYLCGQCGVSYGKGHDKAAMRKIKIHIKGFHLEAYKCSICNKKFTSNDILLQHTKRAHQMISTECDICLRPIKPRYMNSHKFTHMNAEEKAAYIATGFKPPIQNKCLQKAFECATCKKMFTKRTLLRRHEATHLNSGFRKEYKCKSCHCAYTSGQALKEHFMIHHDLGGSKKMCKVCGKTMLAKSLRKHLRTHIAKEDRSFMCKICGARLANAKSLQMHENTHEPTETRENFATECDVCGKMFKTLVSMRNHRRKAHQNHWKLAIPSKLMNEVSLENPGYDGRLEDLSNEGLQLVEGLLLSYQFYNVTQLVGPSKGYRCCTCMKEFVGELERAEEEVKRHIRLEHIGNFRCNICRKRMKNIEEVLAHKRRDHRKRNCVDCEVCRKPGILVKGYKRHIWLHKNPHDVADTVNSGEALPHNYVNEHQAILAELGFHLSFYCVLCKFQFKTVELLYQHRVLEHPDAPKGRVKRKLIGNKSAFADLSKFPECRESFDTGHDFG